MFNNIKIGTKIVGGVIFIIVMCEVFGYYALSHLSDLRDKLGQTSNVELPAVNNLRAIDKEASYIVACERGLALGIMFDDQAIRKYLFAQINSSWDILEKNRAEYEKLPKAENEKQLWNEFLVNFEAWKKHHATGMEALNNKVKLVQAGVAEEDANFQKWDKAADKAELDALDSLKLTSNGLDELVSIITSQAVDSAEKTRLSATTATNVFMVLMIIGGVVSVSLGVFMSRSITNPLKKGVLMMKELEKGHLSNRLNVMRSDEMGDLAKAMDNFADHLQKNVVFNMQRISDGDVNVQAAIIDEKDEIGPALKKMLETINDLVKEMEFLTKSAMEGKLSVRGNAEAFRGAYQDIVQGVNRTLDEVMGPINEAAGVMEKLAGKDITARVTGDYKGDHAKIKQSLNLAVENLDKALQQVAIGADQVASASAQVSSGGQSLSQGASEQASSLEEVSSSLQEMSSMTKQNSLNAREANGVAVAASESAQKGVESMSRMSSAINQIKTSSDATARIVKTIDEIAFQTNLLALNAAVEAARAGDAGKGFAVVAEEVRNLAMRSAEAAKNTANLIEEAVKNSENGVTINTEVLKNFQEITERINKVSQVVAEIAAASEQQDQGITQVNKAVEQMNLLTQQNAANAEESASAAEEMSSQSEEMRSMVAGFKLTGSGTFTKALPIEGQSEQMQNIRTGQKGDKAMSGLQPNPRKVIPLDESDHHILNKF